VCDAPVENGVVVVDKSRPSENRIGDTGKECRSLVVDLVSLRQNIDTPLPAGRLTFQILDAVRKILVYTTVQTRLTVDLSINRGLTFLPFGSQSDKPAATNSKQ
jgi:hypothetical protein